MRKVESQLIYTDLKNNKAVSDGGNRAARLAQSVAGVMFT
jgi:hypothetical protein